MKRSAIALCALLLLSTSCYLPGGPVPDEPVDPAFVVPIEQKVIVKEEFIYSPYPRTNGSVPADFMCDWDCDYIRFLRYRPLTEAAEPKPVKAVIVLIPGYMGGANSFDYMGRQIVSMAEADDDGFSVEVWAMERRGNCMEDLSGMNEAEATLDPMIAVDYYFNGSLVGGRQFQGFHSDADLAVLSEFGLELLMKDVWAAITTKIPDIDKRKQCVFIGGHSMGGAFTSYFAGWDFDANPETLNDAGYMNCAGLIGLDGNVGPRSSAMDEQTYFETLNQIRSGNQPRLNLFTGVTPEAMALLELLAMNAYMYPEEEADIFKTIKYSKETKNLIKLLNSRNLGHYLTGCPKLEDFRYTNEALLGIFLDDNFQPVSFLQASLGFLKGGAVVRKDFPGSLAALLGLGSLIKQDGAFIAWNAGPPDALGTGPLYSWVPFDQVGNTAKPDYKDTQGKLTYTTWMEEVTDIKDFSYCQYNGPSNFMEWYFTNRISVDSQAAAAPFNKNYGLNYLHKDIFEGFPIINFPVRTDPLLEGYNHLDVLFAAADRPYHRANQVFGRMLSFVHANAGGMEVQVP